MAKVGGGDQFANLAVIKVVESAANTLTFKKLETGISLFEKIAWIIQRVEYYSQILATVFDGTGDKLTVALTSTDQLTSLAFENNALIDHLSIQRSDWGAAATAILQMQPLVKDFTNLSGGGIIVPPNPLYLGAVGSGLLAATTSWCRIYYRTIELTPDQYWELVEARRIISST